MSRTLSTPALALAALLASTLDLALVSPLAGADGEDASPTPRPLLIPPGAFLTGNVVSSTALDGVRIRVNQDEKGGYSLVLTNQTPEDRQLAFQLDVYETEGSMMSRMGPMRILTRSEPIRVAVPANGEIVRPLDYGRSPEPGDALADASEAMDPEMLLSLVEQPLTDADRNRMDVTPPRSFADLSYATTEFAITPTPEGLEPATAPAAVLRVSARGDRRARTGG